MINGVVDRKKEHSEQQCYGCCYRQSISLPARDLIRARCGLDLSFIDRLEERLIEVASFVSVRIEEETLGATFHSDSEFLEGLLQEAARLLEKGVDFRVVLFGFGRLGLGD